MSTINWTRLIIAGLVATILCFFSDGFLHEQLTKTDWEAVYRGLHAPLPTEEHGIALAYFLLFEIGRGFVAMILYVLMRPIFRPGPKTAILAAVVAWFAFSFTGPAQFIPLGFYSHALWMKVGAWQLMTSMISTIAGAAIYKERS